MDIGGAAGGEYLSNVLFDLGPDSCDRAVLQDVLQQLAPILVQQDLEVQVAMALTMMCRPVLGMATIRPTAAAWNTALFAAAVLDVFPKLDVALVATALDNPQFAIADPHSAEMLVRGLRALCRDFYGQIPLQALTSPWKNIKGQLSLLFNSLLLSPELLNYSMFPGRKVVASEDFAGMSSAARTIAATLASHSWNSFELFEMTASAIDSDSFEAAKPIFELASRQCPELLCIALASFDPPWNSINKEILVKLTCGFLLGQPSSSVVLPRVWQLNPNTLLFCMVEMHRRDPTCLSRLLDVAQELKVLPIILDAKPYSFTLDLACLASRRQHLNLDKWLVDAIRDKGELFLRAAIDFLAEKVAAQQGRQRGNTPISVPLANDVMQTLVRLLMSSFGSLPPDAAENFRQIHRILNPEQHYYHMQQQQQQQQHQGYDSTDCDVTESMAHFQEMSFAADVEEEVNIFFDRIFSRDIAIAEVIEMLRRLKSSSSVRDQQVLACFLHNIFDEYRFFAKYPDNELTLTALLFGQLINCQLVVFVPLSVALRCVLDALRKPPSQKLFRFGLQALLQFYTRLSEWPQYCAQLIQIPELQQAHPDLFAYIRSCLTGNPIPPPIQTRSASPSLHNSTGYQAPARLSFNVPSTEPALPNAAAAATGKDTATSGNILVEAAERQKVSAPTEAVRDRILFIINNLSAVNLDAKAHDLIKVLEEVHYLWLAQYLVVRRASIEPNYHDLYLHFLEVLCISSLQEQVVAQTYSSIYVLLRSSKIVNSSAERSLLKNLGMWLGGLTLARDRPILYRDLSIKDLLVDAFLADRLIAILPFVCKVLEKSVNSQAFQPENPWLMCILRMLAELYTFEDLKLNLKFEIEVLCKNLQIDLHSLEPSNVLRERSSILLRPLVLGVEKQLPLPNIRTEHTLTPEQSNLASVVLFNPRIPILRLHPIMRKLVVLAVDFAIRELAAPVAQRSFAIASVTTQSFISKDFLPHGDESALRRAASVMAASLSANLAMATARESVKSTIANNLRAFIQWAGLSSTFGDASVEVVSEDNAELAIAYLEKFALEYAQSEIAPIIDALIHSRVLSLRDGSTPVELAHVYDEFACRIHPAPLVSLPPINMKSVTQEELERLAAALSTMDKVSIPPEQLQNEIKFSPMLAINEGNLDSFFESICLRFVELVASLERLIPSIEATTVSKLSANHEVRTLMKGIVQIASSSPIHRDELCLLMSQRLMQGLYKTESPLYVDVIILLLIKIFEFSTKAAKEVTTWVVHSADERKYSVLATTALFSSGLIYVLDFDAQLAKQVESGRDSAAEFAVQLIRKCVFESPQVAAPYDFVYTIEALSNALQENPQRQHIASLLQDIAAIVKAPQPETELLRDQISFCFTDWFRLCQYPSISDKLISSFVMQLYQRHFLKDDIAIRSFFQICTELSVELYVRQRRAPVILAYRSIDAFAKLVAQILRFHPQDPASCSVDRMRIITIAHSVAGVIFVQGLEQNLNYLQRPFTRLFVSMAEEILQNEECLDGGEVIQNLSSFYAIILPKRYPGFVFGWFELIANRHFLPRLLMLAEQKGFPILAHFLSEYLELVYPLLCQYDRNDATRALYRGLLRTFLVILHDMPDFFVLYGLRLTLLLPSTVVQLRNTILTATLGGRVSPDPLSATIDTTMVAVKEGDFAVVRLADLVTILDGRIRATADEFIQVPSLERAKFLLEQLRAATTSAKEMPSPRNGHGWNVEQLALTIAYIGLVCLFSIAEGEDLRRVVGRGPLCTFMSVVLNPAENHCDQYGRYLALGGLADQLLFPCASTSFFCCAMLHLFAEASSEGVKELIARVLLERLIVHRPHPWGVMMAFIELIREPAYRFWESGFPRATPDIERVFEKIARNCLVPRL